MKNASHTIRERRLIFRKDLELEKEKEHIETQKHKESIEEMSSEEIFFMEYNKKLKEWTKILETEIHNDRNKKAIEGQLRNFANLIENAKTNLDTEEFLDDFHKIEYKVNVSIANEQREKLNLAKEKYFEKKEKFKEDLYIKRKELLPLILRKMPKNIPDNLRINIEFRVKQELRNLGRILLINMEEFEESIERVGGNYDHEEMKRACADLENYMDIMKNYFKDSDLNEEFRSLRNYIDSVNFLLLLEQDLDKTVQIILRNSPGQGKNVEKAKDEIRRILKKRVMSVTLKKGSSEDIIYRRYRLEEKIIVAYIADRTSFKRYEIHRLLKGKSSDKNEGEAIKLMLEINEDSQLKKFNIRLEGEADANGVKRISRSIHNMAAFIMKHDELSSYPAIKRIIDKYPDQFEKIASPEYQKYKKKIESTKAFRAYNGLGNELLALRQAFNTLQIDFRKGEPGREEFNALLVLLWSDHDFELVNIVQTNRKKRGKNNRGSRVRVTSNTFPRIVMDFNEYKITVLGGSEESDEDEQGEPKGPTAQQVIDYLNKDEFRGTPPSEQEIIEILSDLKDEDIKNLPEKVVRYVVDHHERFPDIKEKIYQYYVRKKEIEDENKCYEKVYEKMRTQKTPTRKNLELRAKYERSKGVKRVIDLEMDWIDKDSPKLKTEYLDIWIEQYEFLDIDRKNLLDTISFSSSSGLKNEEELNKAKEMLEILKLSKKPKAGILEGEIAKSINKYLQNDALKVEPARIKNIYDAAIDTNSLPQERIPLLKAFLLPDGTYRNQNPSNLSDKEFEEQMLTELAMALFEEHDFEEISKGKLGRKIMGTLQSKKGRLEYIYKFTSSFNNLKDKGIKMERKDVKYLLKNADIEDLPKIEELGEKLRYETQDDKKQNLGELILNRI
ncbi:hypothetical protein GF354_03675 [Candidatus Peregrinibacteria bacterium]|nr:hypothetical protein [Candidatus Peregrinibacteria bacterium]